MRGIGAWVTWPGLAFSLALVASCQGDGSARLGEDAERVSVEAESQVRAAYVAARQAEGDAAPAYAVRGLDGGAFVTTHPATRMRAEMTTDGVTLTRPGEPWSGRLAVARAGCEGAMADMPRATPHAGATANRIEYARGGVTEWYAHGPLGLEQGFTLSVSPCDREVVVEVGVDGLSPTRHDGGAAVDLRDASGVTRVRYTDLSARDADGRALPAEMAVEGGAIALRVDARGARFPVVVDPLAWVQQAELTASDGAMNDEFGDSVAVSGSQAIVGAYLETVGSNQFQGAAYVFAQSGNSWTEQQKLVASDGASNDGFGISVAISGTTAIVGADEDPQGSSQGPGAAYVFSQSGGTWTEQQKLVASDGVVNDLFGYSVSVSGTLALVGAEGKSVGSTSAQGAAYVFMQSGSTWTQEQELLASDGAANDLFGHCVSVSGSTAIVGAYSKTVGSNANQGAAYVFVLSGSTWTQQPELVASDGVAADLFGTSVSISGSTAIVGAPQKAMGSNANQGAAYVFMQSGSTWTQQQELVASDGAVNDVFGSSVSISGGTAFVGAEQKNVGSNTSQGAAYLFVQSGSTWTQQQELVADNGAAGDYFGTSVAVSGSTAIVGASNKTVGSTVRQGAAFVEVYGAANGSACGGPATCPSGNCADGVCCDTPCTGLCQACIAALKQSGVADGTCGPVTAGTNPHDDPCGPDPVSGCMRDGKCDGAGACQLYSASTACGSTCVSNSATAEACNGTGACIPASSGTDCTPAQCVGGVCAASCTTSADCDPTAYCYAGKCSAKVLQGSPCPTVDACAGATAVCVDDYCCDRACTGQCQACDVAGSVGMCSPVVSGAPHGSRAACPGAGTACGATCTPTNQTACVYPSGTSCGSSCTSSGQVNTSSCDGTGKCSPGMPAPCTGNFVCVGTSCVTSCTDDAECATGYVCTGGECTPSGSKCIDGQTSQNSGATGDAGTTDCAPYTCDQGSGRCLPQCTTVADCVSPNVCNSSDQCVVPPSGSSGSSGSGGCAVTPRGSSDERPWALLGLALLAVRAMARETKRRRSRGPR